MLPVAHAEWRQIMAQKGQIQEAATQRAAAPKCMAQQTLTDATSVGLLLLVAVMAVGGDAW